MRTANRVDVSGMQVQANGSHETKRKPLRIAFVTETFLPRIDGTVTRLCQTVKQLRRLGHAVHIIAPQGGLSDFEGASVYGVAGVPFPLYPELKLSPPQPSIGRSLATFQPDLIHAVHPILLGISAFYYSAKMRVPFVISYHAQLPQWLHYYHLGGLEPLLWWGTRSAYNRADLILCTSQPMRTLLLEKGLRRVKLWQRGADTEAFDPQHASPEMRDRLTEGHPQDKLLLYVGRLSAEKNIEQCRAVLQAIPGARLAIVGDGPQRGALEQHFAGTPTYFSGYMRGQELAAAFASADVFLMPSRTETLGLVLLEAMAAGCPVVAAAAGGIPDIVQDGVTGHLYEPENVEEAISAVRRLLQDAGHRETIRARARQDAENWGWLAATQQLEGFYREVLEEDMQLPHRIAAQRKAGASMQEVCDSLQISQAIFRRHAPDSGAR